MSTYGTGTYGTGTYGDPTPPAPPATTGAVLVIGAPHGHRGITIGLQR